MPYAAYEEYLYDGLGARPVRRKGKRRKPAGKRVPRKHMILYKKLKGLFERQTGLASAAIPKGSGARKAQLKYYLAFLGWVKKNNKKLKVKFGAKNFKIASNILRNRVQKATVKYQAST